jgi:uncharacterized protein YqjF (DUF2071 family)
MSFLKAEWRKLALANYAVDPAILKKYVPPKTELDFWNDTCYISLVGFMFLNTKLLGIPVPFHRHFEEVNLRFYVKYKDGNNWKRGVVFIKEIVPKPALTWVANTVYKEHYQTMKMSHEWSQDENSRIVRYGWTHGGKENSFLVRTKLHPSPIAKESEEEFITEHYWGYTKCGPDSSLEYEVTHPRWEVYEVTQHEIDVDFGAVYGTEFSQLTTQPPTSVMLAEGSQITVENKKRI